MGYRDAANIAVPPHPHPSPPLEGEGDGSWLNIVANQVTFSGQISSEYRFLGDIQGEGLPLFVHLGLPASRSTPVWLRLQPA